jgi:tRNA(Ile)-lysidine synthase
VRLQDLPRHLARRCLGVPRFCREVLGVELEGARLAVAYSTGLDSTALLTIAHLLASPLRLTLVAAHAHHGLRPESDAEAEHAARECARLSIPLETARLNVPSAMRDGGPGLEESARTLRYAFLEDVRRKHGCDWIVTAHHADDLTEDIVMRLLRGTGWPGLGGMTGADTERRLLRPLLDWEKDELRELLESVGTAWCDDLSNALTDRTRNRVRSEIVPLLRRENPALSAATGLLWRQARVDETYWEAAMPAVPEDNDGRFLDAGTLDVHSALRMRLFKRVLDSMGPGQATAGHLFLLDKAWTDRKTGSCIQFPGDKAARVESGGVRFFLRKRN